MERKAVSGTMLTLLLIGISTLVFNITPTNAEPRTWTVDDDGPADFSSIQEAVNSPLVVDGDTIFVKAGIYHEHVTIDKSISFIGENKSNTIIDGERTGNVIYVTANNVDISGFTIENGGNRYAGIKLSSNGDNITNNIIWNNWCGIILEHCSTYNAIASNSIMNNLNGISGELWSDSMIIGNTLKDNLLGIWMGPYSSRNTIAFNNIRNHWSEGISMWQSSYNTVVGNNITDSNQGGHWAGMVVGFSSYNQFFHNNIVNKGNQIDMHGEVVNTWDDGYPSGGNYWSDHVTVDDYSGINQDEPGSDGIVDTPYVIDENNQDNYPLMEPWSPRTLLGTGWGWMRIPPKEYVYGRAELYKIGDTQIELLIACQGEEHSRTWNIIFHREYKYGERYLCYSEEWGFLVVGLHEHRRWQFWYAVGKDVVAFGFPRYGRTRLMPI